MAFKKSILPTFARTQTYTDISDKFVKVGLSQHSAPELNALAKAQGCHISRVSYLRQSLYAECVRRPDCADGRLPFDDARALAIAGPIDDLGDPDVLLRNALEAGVVDRRWGHLYLPGFKELYPIRHAHERAKLARAKRDRPQLMARARAYRRAYLERHPVPRRTKVEEDLLLPSKASPQGPDPTEVKSPFTANIRGTSGGLVSPRSAPDSVAKRYDKDLTKISPPSGDVFYEVLDAHSSKSPRLKSFDSFPALPVHECEPPSSSASLDEDQKGGEHVRINQGQAEQTTQTTPTPDAGGPWDCTEGKGRPDAGSEAQAPQQPVIGLQMPSARQFGQPLPAADFRRHVGALFALRAANAEAMAVFKEQMGADWKIVEQLLGPTPASELNKMDDRTRELSMGMLLRRHARIARCREAAQPVPKASGEQLLAALGVHKPATAAAGHDMGLGQVPSYPSVPAQRPTKPLHRDSLPAIVERVCGRRAGEVYVGPDLVHRVKQLPVSPEQVELAFKEAAQRPPASFSALGWAALTRLERVAGLRPALEQRN